MTTKPTERDLIEEVDTFKTYLEGYNSAVQNPTLAQGANLLRRLVGALRERDELIVHMHVHSGYKNNGYLQMTTPQKELYDAIWNRSVKELEDEERNSD